MMYRRIAIVLIFTAAMTLSLAVYARPGIVRKQHPVRGSYVVVLKHDDGTSPAVRAAELARTFGGRVSVAWEHAIRGFAIEALPVQAEALSHSAHVDWVEEDAYGSVLSVQTTDSFLWGLDRIDQRNRPLDGTFDYCDAGTGVRIYVVDTGVWNLHVEFDLLSGGGNRVEPGMDFVECSAGCVGHADSPCSAGASATWPGTSFHGTAVASVAAGLTTGVAKDAIIVPVRAINCAGNMTTSRAISAVDWVDADHQPGELAVMNCSFKIDKDAQLVDAFTAAVNDVIDDGVVVVAGAGNDNQSASALALPLIDRVITVGASDRLDQRWIQSDTVGSNYGSKVDVFAPGKGIRVADIADYQSYRNNVDGTSLSTPFVSGVVAQYLQTHPTASPADVYTWITTNATADVLTSLGVGSPNRLLYMNTCD